MTTSFPLPVFIRKHLGAITEEWRDFAATIALTGTSDLVLRDHIHKLLFYIADDIETHQTAKQQVRKSLGKSDADKASPGAIHGELRYNIGFDVAEMVSEYRALRATVTKLWTNTRLVLTDSDITDLIRFNEAIDQLMAQSIVCFLQQYPLNPKTKKA